MALGNAAMMQTLGIPLGEHAARKEALEDAGKTAMYVAVDGVLAGIVGVADTVRETAPDALRNLEAMGLTVVMATGDSSACGRDRRRRIGHRRGARRARAGGEGRAGRAVSPTRAEPSPWPATE